MFPKLTPVYRYFPIFRHIHSSKPYNKKDEKPVYVEVVKKFEKKKGVLSKEDLSAAFRNLLGYKGDERSIEMMFGTLDLAKKGYVDHDSLVLYVEKLKLPKAEEILVKAKKLGGNKLGKSDLRKILGWAVPGAAHYDAKEDAIEELLDNGIKIFDSDGDGKLNHDEFVELYSCFLFFASIITP